MKKLIFIVVVCLMLLPTIQAQTLHAIIFANTKSPGNPNKPNDRGIGPSVTVDFERMKIEMKTIARVIDYNLKEYYYYDTQERFSRTCLEEILNTIKCGKNDIVFFYYSGHGLRAANEQTIFPEMVLKVAYGPASTQQLYPLYDVYQKLKAKSPRLTIVFGDLCNSTDKGFYRDYGNGKGASTKSSSVCDIYKNLFRNVKGGIIATSSKPNQISGCASFTDGTDAGGRFTASFLGCLQDFVSSSTEVSWEQLMNATTQMTQRISPIDTETGERQTPVYQSELSQYIPASNTSTQSSSAPTANDAETVSQDNLADALTTIANSNLSPIERYKKIATVESRYFADAQIKVEVVGRNSKTIVATKHICDYLNYLSIATNMEQVMVLNVTKNENGKINYLKVHEMHRK